MRDRSENQIKLILIRHGATKSNAEHKYLGKTNEALSSNGKMQLMENKKLQLYPDIDLLFTSPMKRCLQTAEILYPTLCPIQMKEWVEMDFGIFEGKNYMDLKDDIQYQAWIDSNGLLPFPNGESREEFIARCDKGFQKMLNQIKLLKEEKNITDTPTIGMIVHGGTIMALLSKYGEGEYFDYQVTNGTGYICMVKDIDAKPNLIQLEKIEQEF